MLLDRIVKAENNDKDSGKDNGIDGGKDNSTNNDKRNDKDNGKIKNGGTAMSTFTGLVSV